MFFSVALMVFVSISIAYNMKKVYQPLKTAQENYIFYEDASVAYKRI
jgi:hypothetical protein